MGRTAARLEQQLDTFTTGEASVLIRPGADQTPSQAKAEIERALSAVDRTKIKWDVTNDDTDHSWVILRDRSLEVLAAGMKDVGDVLVRGGLGARVMAAVWPFRWRDTTANEDRRIYWIYQPRLKGYTPFVPLGDPESRERDHPLEIRMEEAIRRDLPTHRQVSDWYPIWGMPV